MRFLSVALLSLSFLSPFAFAEDDDWLEDEEDEEEKSEKEEELSNNAPAGEGEDTADIYRQALKEFSSLDSEEELIEWNAYLKRYPNSKQKGRIETRIDELTGKLFEGDIDQDIKNEDGRAELLFAQPLMLENIDPRTKLRFAFEMGLPNYINLLVDYEHQLMRELSVHGTLRKRYTGWSIEGGARYALLKSAEMKALVTAIGDVHINADPNFIGFRPQIAAGKRFDLPGGYYIDAQAQVGTDLELFNGEKAIQPLLIGGAHIMFAASDTVRIYVEAHNYMKDFFWEGGGVFAFNTVTFGMKFLEKNKGIKSKYEIGLGTTIPFFHNYWRYHYGSITGDYNLFMD